MTFALDPQAEGTLSEQLADQIRRAIARGTLKRGDVLPGIRELAAMTGTSVRVPQAAMKILADENLVKARPRLGCTVLARDSKTWKGRVLVVSASAYEGYYHRGLLNTLIDCLVRARYHVDQARVLAGAGERLARADLRRALGGKYDLVIVLFGDRRIIDMVRRAGLPFFVCACPTAWRGTACVGGFESVCDHAFLAVARRAKAVGVRRAVQVRQSEGPDAREAFARQGIEVRDVVVWPEMSERRLESFVRCGLEAVAKLLAKGDRPDLLILADDYLAIGGLQALAAAGVRVPEDLRLVAFANYGLGPVCPKPLDRIESNPFSDGRHVAECLLRFLSTGKFLGLVNVDRPYLPGETLV